MPNFLQILCYLFVTLPSLAQPVVYVTQSGAGSGSGLSWSNALPGTLLAGNVATASAGTQFWIAAGTYKPTTTTDRTASFSLASGVQLYGGFAGTELGVQDRRITHPSTTTLSGNIGSQATNDNSFHVVVLENSSNATHLDNLVISDANASDEPLLQSNVSLAKGAIINTNSSARFTNCLVTRNTTYSPLGRGGGVANFRSSPTFVNCIFSENFSYLGGGMYNGENSAPTIINSLFTSNSAVQGGVGSAVFSNLDSQVSLINCTVARNTDAYPGPVAGNRQLTNCIVCESVKDVYATWPTDGSGRNCTLPGNNLSAAVSIDLLFVDPLTGNFRLRPNSPAIDAGSPYAMGLPATDLAGQVRVQNGRVDVGAYEFFCIPAICWPVSAQRIR